MSFNFIRDHAERWPIRLMCRVLEVSASGYYAWRHRPESARARASRSLLADLRRLHGEHHGRYGSPRMHAALRTEGRTASRGRVERLMRRHGIVAREPNSTNIKPADSRYDRRINGGQVNRPLLASIRRRMMNAWGAKWMNRMERTKSWGRRPLCQTGVVVSQLPSI